MQKVRVAVCIGDKEYASRFANCLLGHYHNQFELHIFEELSRLAEEKSSYDVLLCGDYADRLPQLTADRAEPIVYLWDREEMGEYEAKEERVFLVEKYQEVNRIVDEVLKHIGDEVRSVHGKEGKNPGSRILGVYSLSENEYQLPFVVTMGSILSDRERVLIVDLQENSGFSQLAERGEALGLEEVLVMAESQKVIKNRLLSCIGHLDYLDFIFPAENTQVLCEADADLYRNMFLMLSRELDYDVILVNFGVRFIGFFETLKQCSKLYFMQKNGGPGQWREKEFLKELEERGDFELLEKMVRVDLPQMPIVTVSCERLVEQWKWNEFGDVIRRITPEVGCVG